MKKILAVILFSSLCMYGVKAQDVVVNPDENINNEDSTRGNGSSDRFMLDLYTDIWQGADSSVSVSSYSPGVDIYGMFDYPFGKSGVSLGLGLGIGVHNMRSNAMPVSEVQYDSTLGQYTETGRTIFERIPEKVNDKEIEYDINKLTLTYVDIPLEFRYRITNKNSNTFKFALGFKAGYLIASHTKYKGKNPDGSDSDIKYKTFRIKNIEPLKYGATFRLGYEKFNVFGYYSLSKLFKTDKGPEMYPVSVGICFTPF